MLMEIIPDMENILNDALARIAELERQDGKLSRMALEAGHTRKEPIRATGFGIFSMQFPLAVDITENK